jgi:hypothetical protein
MALALLLVAAGPTRASARTACPSPRLPAGSSVFSSGHRSSYGPTYVAEVSVDATYVYWRDDARQPSLVRTEPTGIVGLFAAGGSLFYSCFDGPVRQLELARRELT